MLPLSLLLVSSLELVLAYPPTSLLPLERQKKSLQEDLAYFLPEEPYTSFRQRQLDREHRKRSSPPSSIFSERQRFIESQTLDDKRRRQSKRPFDTPQRSDAAAYSTYETHLDPWFPALEVQRRKKQHDDLGAPRRGAVDAALKRLAWERLNKRLTRLHAPQGPYLDRGERRLRIRKRAPVRAKTVENKKVLEAILSDDADRGLDNDTNSTKMGKNVTGDVSVHKGDGGKSAPAQTKHREPKGKQWVPLDSEHTLRSKKSWDEYFGMDKRSPRWATPKQWQFGRADDDDDEDDDSVNVYGMDDSMEADGTEGEQELKDYMVQWYFNKMLRHFLPLDDDDVSGEQEVEEEEEGDRKKMMMKKKKKKSLGSEANDLDNDDDDDDSSPNSGEEVPFEEVDARLRKIEDAILMEATRLLEQEAEIERMGPQAATAIGDEDEIQKGVVDHLKAAFSLEKMRDALEEFQDSFDKINFHDRLQREILDEISRSPLNLRSNEVSKEEDNDRGDDNDDKKKKKRKKKKSGMVKRVSKKMGNVAVESHSQSGVTRSDLTNEVAVPVFTPNHQAEQNLPCPVLTEALGYCEELSNDLDEMGRVLARPCVEHMLCYTCDESPAMCDAMFLQQATTLCEEDFQCQAIASAMRSVFLSNHDAFRRRNHGFCDIDQCLMKLQGIK